ncbi:holo-ACP synthase [Candidatus Pelagibacter sp.]|jgi:holo-[acyl-carrier protein] synthase|nr:holo-ACP synthase [Candidatus Pelagibacter sp.]
MKTIGIGVDITQNKRIKVLIKKKNFITRIFGKREILHSKKKIDKTSYFAKRFAAKESLMKAIGTGFRGGMNFNDIEVVNNHLGKPYYLLNKKLKSFIKKKMNIKNFDLFLSISDEKEYSIAFTILQTRK